MRLSSFLITTTSLLFLMSVTATTYACGKERWLVKVGNDADASKVDLSHAIPTTIAALDALKAPSVHPDMPRGTDVERTVYVLNAFVTAYKHETDGDYHLALSDTAGHTLIAEIPDSACLNENSPFRSGVIKARQEFDAELTASGKFKKVHIPVRVIGVGFFDFHHGQLGVAPNAIELHPVLDIQFTQ